MNRMKLSLGAAVVLVVAGSAFVLFGKKEAAAPGDGGPVRESDLTKWEYATAIPAPIAATADGKSVTLGSVAEHAVAVAVPEGAFERATEVRLVTPGEVPGYVADDMRMIGSPIEIDSSGEKRLNSPLEITFRAEQAVLDDAYEAATLRMVYHDGQRWDTIKPVKLDAAAGTATFHLYHFSLGGLSKVDPRVVTEKWIKSQALNNYVASQTGELSDAVAEKAIDLALGKLGISDETVKGAILTDIIKNDSYKEMYDAYKDGDVSGFNQKFSILLGQKIADRVPESALKSALSGVADGADDIATVSQAAGYAAEGQYKDAAKLVGEMIADKFLITTAGKIAVEVVKGQVDSWKNEEVDAAYRAYKEGANGYFWGYNVDPGDFDGVWSQMRGVGRQIEIDAIAKENAVREDAGLPELTEREADKVRAKIKEAMRQQFEARSKNEDKLANEADQLRLLINTFKDAGFLDRYGGPEGIEKKGYDLETKLDVLHHFARKMMRETGRGAISDKTGLIMKDKISADDILMGARYYFAEPDGRAQYAKFVKERFGIDLYPKLSDLAGKWDTHLVITEVKIDESVKKAIADKKAGRAAATADNPLAGCDFDIDLEGLVGKTSDAPLLVTPSGDSGGTLTFGAGEDAKQTPFTYEAGRISSSISQDGGSGTIVIAVSEEDKGYAMDGTVTIGNEAGTIKIVGTLTSSRPKAAKK